MFYAIEQGPDCLRANTVTHILVHDGATEYVPVCGVGHPRGLNRLQRDLGIVDLVQSDLRKFDQLIYGLGTPIRPIRVNVMLNNDYLVQLTANEIWVGRKVLESNGQFLKIMNSAWLLQVNPKLAEHAVFLETLADLFVAAESGGLELENPNNKKVAEYTGAKEIQKYTILQLCQSEWVPTSQIEFCRALTRESTEQSLSEAKQRLSQVRSQFSMRPFLGNALWARFMRAGVSEKFSTLENVIKAVSEGGLRLETVPEQDKDWYDYVNRALRIFDFAGHES